MAQEKPKGVGVVIAFGRPRGDDQRHAADVEAAFTGKPQPYGTFDAEHDGGKVSAQSAGYMELEGAVKDGDCDLVNVGGGVSQQRGCCNLFDPQEGAQQFRCGTCEHVIEQQQAREAMYG